MTTTQRRPQPYPSLLADGLKLWNEARRAAGFDDSLFIWIPKNAGTSVYKMLRPHGLVKLRTTRSARLCFRNSGRVTFGHMAIESLVDLDLVSRDFVDRAFKFAFSRDPYARAASLYRYLLDTHVLRNWHEQPTFGEFLRLIADGLYDRIGAYNSRGLSQCNPQVEWLRGVEADKIYRVENLADFIADISERWKIPKSRIPHANQSAAGVRIDLSREEKALIGEIYAEDFNRFGYSKR
jgi:hypothetical protein